MSRSSTFGEVVRLLWKGTEGKVGWTVLLALVVALTEGISITMLIPIVASTSPETAQQAADIPLIGDLIAGASLGLPFLLALFIVLICVQAALNYLRNYYSLHLMQLLSDRLKRSLFHAVSHAEWDAIARRRLSDVNQVFVSGIPRCMTAANAFNMLVQAAILIAIYVAIAAAVSWQMALFAVLVGAALFAAMYPLRRRASRYGHELTEMFQQQSRVTLDFLNGVRLAKTFVAERHFMRSFDGHLGAIRRSTLRFYAQSSLGSLVFQIGVAVFAASFVYLAVEVFDLGLARIAVLLVIFARLAPRFGVLQDQGQQYLSNAPAYAEFTAMMTYFRADQEQQDSADIPPPRLARRIALTGVSKIYENGAQPSLDNVTVTIAAGRITSLLGSSGSGKSTLADIVSGLVTPTAGAMLVDETPIDATNRRVWRSRVATVPQDAFLFDVSLRENMRLAKADASEGEIWSALERARIAALVRSLPDGLDTEVGNRGTRFSGGERQRFAIARALLPDPEILILDEATSALDADNQRKVAETILALRDGGLTILLIAHQPLLADIADDRIVLERGRLQAERA
ncbi:ABC transporter ATP-binding protein [Qipengyuania spongiae]|uniref:ABC transporter ATP-binding protein/permease n=1 Tax=Qipengyuania spongiae TaxID=2909673 RepID=A0ABY5SX17_9SPHN|nr:ABC transporter ATP-binding protein [Qipengyuania spongiae]UVI39087.1 ABC transporter ATP-binding protein/permease [Qipengyuania spongiae]